jgi:ferredoxin
MISPSTRAFYREFRDSGHFTWSGFLHGYVYARWPYFYIGFGLGRHPLSRVLLPLAAKLWPKQNDQKDPDRAADASPGRPTFADTYHGKAMPPAQAAKLIRVERDVDLGDLEKVVPYATARDMVLKNPESIALLDCPCRLTRKDHCRPVDVCVIMGEPFASFIAEHHPGRSRMVGPDEALEVLAAAHRRGEIHHAFFKDGMIGRFYAICNCCSCCCGAMQAQRNGVPMLCSSGYVSVVDEPACRECGTCVQACPFEALSLADGACRVAVDKCMGCGVCVGACPEDALSLVRDPAKGESLEIDELMDRAG